DSVLSDAGTSKPDSPYGSPTGRSPAVIPTPDLGHLIVYAGNDMGQPTPSLLDNMINMTHIRFLVHFSLVLAVPELGPSLIERNTQLILKTGSDAPYLMHEILALSARHMSILEPENAMEILHDAVQLQTRAPSCVPLVLFSAILGRHLCVDALAFRSTNLDPFIDCYVNFARIRRGVRVIVSRAWALLKTSELVPLMSWGLGLSWLKGVGPDCDSILDLISASPNISAADKEIYMHAVDLIQVALDDLDTRVFLGRKYLIQMVFSWSLMVSEDYTRKLSERKPEAIAVLAYYAAILHLARDLWQIGDSGAYLLQVICQHLGDEWAERLILPRKIRAMLDKRGSVKLSHCETCPIDLFNPMFN
ncbi:hypothetical protein BDP81DRAFT_497485, partial [Colletotrichum phormii]